MAIIKKIFIICYVLVLITSCSYKTDRKDKILQRFSENQSEIGDIAQFLCEENYETIHISLKTWDESTMYAGLEYGNVAIDNTDIINKLLNLSDKGYSVIHKTGKIIFFQDYSTKDFGCGILYNPENEIVQSEFLTRIETTETTDWFYYEESG